MPFKQACANLSELAVRREAGGEKFTTKYGESYVALIDADLLDHSAPLSIYSSVFEAEEGCLGALALKFAMGIYFHLWQSGQCRQAGTESDHKPGATRTVTQPHETPPARFKCPISTSADVLGNCSRILKWRGRNSTDARVRLMTVPTAAPE